jgi:hypothetical protein
MVMAGTVIRESVLLALRWSGLDYINRLIRIRRPNHRAGLNLHGHARWHSRSACRKAGSLPEKESATTGKTGNSRAKT